jgi:type II restriction/modification system DNA methylase subunit YeeA
VIIGNPPFLGGKKQRTELGDKYVDDLFTLYKGRVSHEADFVCYWFEKAREQIVNHKAKRVGLLATQGIRGGANRMVLERIKDSGDIFWAQSDRDWILDGATVHVSMVGFDDSTQKERTLDGKVVSSINANLTSEIDLTKAKRLSENTKLSFMGDTKGGPFDIGDATAQTLLNRPINPNGRPNSDVIHPWINGSDIAGRRRGMWIIDFGIDTPENEASLYEAPFEYAQQYVRPERVSNQREIYRERWWLHARPRPAFREAVRGLTRYIATPRVSKHRLFVWVSTDVLPDSALIAIARDDDYMFGVLHSRIHELWARQMGTQLREVESGFRYTPETTFETFSFPWPPRNEPKDEPRLDAIATAARDLANKRDAWLNPPGASAKDLKERTLTNLYNLSPSWLKGAHRELDDAVFAAYGWSKDVTDQEILTRLLGLNAERFAAS